MGSKRNKRITFNKESRMKGTEQHKQGKKKAKLSLKEKRQRKKEKKISQTPHEVRDVYEGENI